MYEAGTEGEDGGTTHKNGLLYVWRIIIYAERSGKNGARRDSVGLNEQDITCSRITHLPLYVREPVLPTIAQKQLDASQ